MTLAAALLLAAAATASPVLLDGFESTAPWQADASDGVTARVAAVPGAHGKALRLAYDFDHVSGYAYAHRQLAIDWPANYRIRFRLRGTGGVNDLQLKFVDASGQNVWWWTKPNFRASSDWQDVTLRPRDLSFAWGPTADKVLRTTARVELVVVRGRDGGSGSLEIDDLRFEPLPPPAPLPPPKASVPAAIDNNPATVWRAKGGDALLIDFGGEKELGGLSLHWAPGQGASAYTIAAADDRQHWRTLRTVTQGDGGDDPIRLPDTVTRYLRLALPAGAPPAALADIDIEPLAWGATANATIEALAKTAPRGTYPRGFSGQQPYWTLVGTDGGSDSGLIGEDGAIEVGKGAFSIEPFVTVGDTRYDWANVHAAQSLEDGYLPLPHVTWTAPGWRLDTSVFADATAPRLMARWRLTNTGSAPIKLTLALAIRPFQVNPPAQFLSQQGGTSGIDAIRWAGDRLIVTRAPAIAGDPAISRTLHPLMPPARVTTAPFDRGALAHPAAPDGAAAVTDPAGLASAALLYPAKLAPGETLDIPMVIPFGGGSDGGVVTPAVFAAAHAATIVRWKSKLDRVAITVPPAHQAVADTVRTALAHILMSRDGAALKPGTRSYDRSWIRDGTMISDTLLRLGVDTPVAAFADWYRSKLFANGKVPCCVDFRGPDPVPENDAQGEFIHLLTQLYRYTGDRARLAAQWPAIDAARRYMEQQRQSERTPANQTADRRMLYGLMPPSISHEGYSAKPQYSLWDDFWALTGYKDAAFAARVLDRAEAPAIAAERDQFAADIHAAIAASVRHFGIDFIPGATSLGDFDATSTTIALDPAGEKDALDPTLLANTFDRQWRRVTGRDAAGADWTDYTPYELRNVSAMVRLGWRARADRLLDIYMGDRRPAAWNGWAEVVGRNPREIRFIGDMPHAWVASDFIRAALDLFAYERASDRALVLGAGLGPDWLSGGGSSIRGLRTPFGTLDLAMRGDADQIEATVGGTATPPGGFVVPSPFGAPVGRATIDGRTVPIGNDGLHVPADGRVHHVVLRR